MEKHKYGHVTEWIRKFAIIPTKMDNGEWIWLSYYQEKWSFPKNHWEWWVIINRKK